MSESLGKGVFSNWKRWQVDLENSHRQPGHDSYDLHRTSPQPVIANASRSDPESIRCGRRNCSRDEYSDDKLHPVSTWNNTVTNPRASRKSSRTAACQFSRCSSYTEGFRTDNEDDEPNDTLVWDSNVKQHPNSARSISNNNSRREASISDDESVYSFPSRRPPTPKPSTYDGQLAGVAQQLEKIKTTQDSILSELSNDISSLQYENVQLKNTNEHLTLQNSHLLQVIHELSQEVESMRQIFRNRGWSIGSVGMSGPSKDLVEKHPLKHHHQTERVSSGKRRSKKVNEESSRTGEGEEDMLQNEEEELCESPIPGDDQVNKLSNSGSKTHQQRPRSRRAEKHRSAGDKNHISSDRKKEKVVQEEPEPEEPAEVKQGCFQKLFSKKPKRTPRQKNNE